MTHDHGRHRSRDASGRPAQPPPRQVPAGQQIQDAKKSRPCELLLRARLVPDRAGADTRVIAHIPISQLRQMPGADRLEDAWIRARLGEDGYLAGQDAETAACDAQTVPVVTGDEPGLEGGRRQVHAADQSALLSRPADAAA